MSFVAQAMQSQFSIEWMSRVSTKHYKSARFIYNIVGSVIDKTNSALSSLLFDDLKITMTQSLFFNSYRISEVLLAVHRLLLLPSLQELLVFR